MQPLPCEVCGEINEYERKEQQLAKQKKCVFVLRKDHILVFSEVFETLLMIAVGILEVPLSHNNNWYLLVVQDNFTKWADAIPLPDQTAT